MRQALRYSLQEAARSLWRGRQSGIVSTATIALALFVLGAFLLVTTNLERLSAEWSSAAELSVYVKDDIAPADRLAIEKLLAPGEVVASREFVSKEEALTRFRQTFSELAGSIDGGAGNPLPASFEVRLRPTAGERLDSFAQGVRGAKGVADVRYDRQWLTRLLDATRTVRTVGLTLGAVLILAAALTVANVVRLSLYARRDELEIMQLVGAPTVYVRGPFLMEGVLQGGIGAIAAVAVLAVAFFSVRGRYLVPLASAMNLSSIAFLSVEVMLLLVFGGMAVGCLGGLVAARVTQS
jgi:cell division transport system permease protein